MHSRQLYLFTWPSLFKSICLCSQVYIYPLLKERLAPAEPSGRGGGHSCPQGTVGYHQDRKGRRAGKRDPAQRLELIQRQQRGWVWQQGHRYSGKSFFETEGEMNKFCCCSESNTLIEPKHRSKFQSTGTQWAAED